LHFCPSWSAGEYGRVRGMHLRDDEPGAGAELGGGYADGAAEDSAEVGGGGEAG